LSLLELLVCVGILAILLSIVLPAIARSRLRAYDANHMAALRQLAVAQSLYADEAGAMPLWTPPLVRAGYLEAALLASPFDPNPMGAANVERGGGDPGTSFRPTPYKDSVFGLHEYAGGTHREALLASRGAGWAVFQADPPDWSSERYPPMSSGSLYSERYFRLLLDGSVVMRRIRPRDPGPGRPYGWISMSWFFTDDESITDEFGPR
jgi:type II secretory pathway pseudopilin PulG